MIETPVRDSASGSAPATIRWDDSGAEGHARWRSERGAPPSRRVLVVDDTLTADTAFRHACEGTGMLWRGDFQNARQLLQALTRRLEKSLVKRGKAPDKVAVANDPHALFNRHRQLQAHSARVLGQLLIPMTSDYRIDLRRAPDVREACIAAWGPPEEGDNGASESGGSVVSLRELLGIVGAWEWRRKGIEVHELGAPPGNRIHPHYGVFAPIRTEYTALVAAAPLPMGAQIDVAWDIGTGTGVLAALLARRGVRRVVATELDPRTLACARDNIARLGLEGRVTLREVDLFPEGRAQLIVCNPPWLPARPSAPIERAVYDEGGRMLAAFLCGLAQHLAPGGEGWLILSDLAEHLRLRSRADLLAAFEANGLAVVGRIEADPQHPRAAKSGDLLQAARANEVVSLWRLSARGTSPQTAH